jgi:ABC-type transporter Mla subunit MlaD
MTEPVLVRELEQIRDSLRDGFSGVHERLDTINGRLRQTESAVCVLEDRSDRTERALSNVPDTAVRWTSKRAAQIGGVGVVGGGALVALIELGRALVQHFGK